MGSSFDHGLMAAAAFIVLAALGLDSFSSTASAQYVSSTPASPSPAQLEECERLGIDPENCTENAILAKQRLMQAQGVPAQQSGEVIVLTAVSVGNQTDNNYDARIVWTPADLGQPNNFHIEIFDANQLESRDPMAVRFDIKIYQGDKYLRPAEPTGNNAVQNADFSHDYTFVFLEAGSYSLAIEDIENQGEGVTIPIQVTPEFPIVTGVSIVLASTIAVVLIVSRTRLF